MKIGYARVSTEDQNLRLQTDALKAAHCDEIHHDWGVSGAQMDRPGLKRALARLNRGDILVVWRLDRLGRSLLHLIQIINQLRLRGVEFVSLNENIDTSTSSGRLVFHMMAALAEFERSLISERTRAGMMAARSDGRHLGRPAALDAIQERMVVRAVQEMGEPVQAVAERFNVTARTIRRALQRAADTVE
jgi:DNA invertase Pin-like site-specific DNA recombinase